MIPIVALAVVGTVMVVWVGLFIWSGIRAVRGSRLRAPPRDRDNLPDGFALGIREPEALRAPFVLTLRGSVVDVAESLTSEFRGGVVGVTDLTLRHVPDAEPSNHTVVSMDVEWRWPWMRLRRTGVAGPAVEFEATTPREGGRSRQRTPRAGSTIRDRRAVELA